MHALTILTGPILSSSVDYRIASTGRCLSFSRMCRCFWSTALCIPHRGWRGPQYRAHQRPFRASLEKTMQARTASPIPRYSASRCPSRTNGGGACRRQHSALITRGGVSAICGNETMSWRANPSPSMWHSWQIQNIWRCTKFSIEPIPIPMPISAQRSTFIAIAVVVSSSKLIVDKMLLAPFIFKQVTPRRRSSRNSGLHIN